MTPADEFAVRIEFRRGDDGYCCIGSPDLVGLHLAGPDLSALRGELDTIIRDLVWFNHGRVIDAIRWIPNLDQVEKKYADANAAIVSDQFRNEICLLQLEAA